MTDDSRTLGSGPIEEAYRNKMTAIASALDDFLNDGEKPRKHGYVLLVFEFGEEGRCNYMSNADRSDVVRLLREQLRYFEGAPDNVEGRA